MFKPLHQLKDNFINLIAAVPFLLGCPVAIYSQDDHYPIVSYQNDPGSEPREHVIDMQRMRVEVAFEPQRGLVKGRVTHIFVPLRSRVDSIFFDGPGIRILAATLNGKALRFVTTNAGVTVFPNPSLQWRGPDSITFTYEATPRKGIYFIGWNDPKNLSHKQIWTQGQGIDNRYWIPCYDEMNDKMITETIVTFDKEYQVLSNGVKVPERDNGDGTKTWHYAMSRPHSSYLLMLGIGKYAVETRTTKRGVPVHLWYYPEFPDQMEPTYRYSAEAVDFMEEQTGIPYPWESYSQIPVQDFIYGAMENTTATVFGDFFLVDQRAFLDRSYIEVNVHELAHQWFGDFITGRSSKSAWLQESFATFYPTLFVRRIFGEDQYQWNKRLAHNAALSASETDRYPIVHTQAGGARIYQKGAAVLDMMMYTFGEAEFKAVIQYYLRKHAYSNVVTTDFYHAFQDTLGLTPDWFFEQWLYRGGEPHYEVSYEDVNLTGSGKRQTEITVRQVHPTDELVKLFNMPIVFEVHYTDGSFDSRREWINEQAETVVIPNSKNKQVAFVLFDPGSYILKKVTFKKHFAELKAQVLHAPFMIDRYDAVVAMRSEPLSVKRDALLEIYDKNPFYAIRSEIVAQVMGDADTKSVALLKKAINSPDARVRLSVVTNMKSVPQLFLPDIEQLLQDSSYSIVLAALEKLTAQVPENTNRYLELTKHEYGPGNEIKVKWYEIRAALGEKSSLDALVEYTSGSYEFRTRVNALNALKRLNYLDDAFLPNLFDALLHPNNRLRGPAASVAEYFYQQVGYAKKMQQYYYGKPWEPWQREALERTIK